MKQLFTTFLLLFSMLATGQNNWKPIAKAYLSTIEGANAWLMAPESENLLDSMVYQIIDEYNPARQNRYLLHMLANLSLQRGIGDYNKYLESALLAHRADSISKVLLLMEYSSFTLSQVDSPFYKDLLDSAGRILKSQRHQDVQLNIRLLKEYASLYPYDDAATEPIAQLTEAIKTCHDSLGTDNQLYLSLMSDLSAIYRNNGNVEKHYQLEGEIASLRLNDFGASQLDESVFTFKQPDLSKIPLSRIRSAYLLMAKMYEQTSNSYFNSRMAAKLYELASKYQKAPQYKRVADFALTVGQRYMAMEEYGRAVNYLKKALTNYEKIQQKPLGFGDTREVSELLLAKAYYGTAQFEKALVIYQKYEEKYRKMKDYRKAIVHNLILTNYRLGDFEEVKKYTQLILEIKGQFVADEDPLLFRKYGNLNAQAGDYEAAYEFLKLAYDEYWDLASFSNMEAEEEEEEFDENMLYNEDMILEVDTDAAGLTIYDRASLPQGESYTDLLRDLAFSAYRIGKYAECTKYIEKYINRYYTVLHFERENASYSGYQQGSDLNELYKLKEVLFPMYELFQLAIIKDKSADEDIRQRRLKLAYNQILDSKSNIQFEFRHMMQQIADSKDSTLKATFRQYSALRESLSKKVLSGDEEVSDLKSKLNNLRLTLSAASAAFKPVDKQFTFWSDVQKTLTKNEALIEMRRVKDHLTGNIQYVAFLINSSSSHPEMIVFPDGDLMEGNLIKSYKNSIKFKIEDFKSYDAFWKPLSPYLSDIKKIYFSPDGVYHQLNVITLFNVNAKKYVGDEFQVIQVISGKQLTQNTRKNGKIRKATLIGRPAYEIDTLMPDTKDQGNEVSKERSLTRAQITSGKIADLPGTETEVKNISQILNRRKISTDLFLGNKSTEANFKKSAGGLIHIATHGFWFEENSESQADAMFQSGLLLAGAKNYAVNVNGLNDGILTAYEIQGMSLENTQLAVMSACETGLGKISVGEGVFGLQRAFIIAGVDQLLMSLWKVDDEATQQLFTVFYKEWIQKGKEVSEAFAKAQKVMRKKYKHPYYWGAFVLVD